MLETESTVEQAKARWSLGLKVYKDGDTTGEEYPTKAGRIDILSNLIPSLSQYSQKNCAKFNP